MMSPMTDEEEFLRKLRERSASVEGDIDTEEADKANEFSDIEEHFKDQPIRSCALFSPDARAEFGNRASGDWLGMMSKWSPEEVPVLDILARDMSHASPECEIHRRVALEHGRLDGAVQELLGEMASDAFSFIFMLNRMVNDQSGRFGITSLVRECILMVYAQSLVPMAIGDDVSWIDFMDALKAIDRTIQEERSGTLIAFGTPDQLADLVEKESWE